MYFFLRFIAQGAVYALGSGDLLRMIDNCKLLFKNRFTILPKTDIFSS